VKIPCIFPDNREFGVSLVGSRLQPPPETKKPTQGRFLFLAVQEALMRTFRFDNLPKEDWTLEQRDDAPQG
jgi:hypothetical protein